MRPSPVIPRARAAANERSSIRPRTYGPRSVIVTTTCRRPCWTLTRVPNGNVLCAAVKALGLKRLPLALRDPDSYPYHDAIPVCSLSFAADVPDRLNSRARKTCFITRTSYIFRGEPRIHRAFRESNSTLTEMYRWWIFVWCPADPLTKSFRRYTENLGELRVFQIGHGAAASEQVGRNTP